MNPNKKNGLEFYMASTWMSMDHSRVKLCRKQDPTRDSITHELWQELILYLWDYVTNMTWMVFQFSQSILLWIVYKALFVSITFSREILSFLPITLCRVVDIYYCCKTSFGWHIISLSHLFFIEHNMKPKAQALNPTPYVASLHTLSLRIIII